MTARENRDTIERRDAARLLLRQPLVLAAGPHAETFRIIRAQRDWLIDTFAQYLGYRLVVETGFARLYKSGLSDSSRPAVRSTTQTPFTPRAYTYLTLAIAALLTCREQLLLSQLVTSIRTAATDASITLDDSPAERRTLTAALRHLVGWGVIAEDEGHVDRLADDPDAEALLTVNRAVVRHLVAGPLRRAASPEELIAEAADAGLGAARHGVRRKLVETPAVYLDDLDDEERTWLRHNQRREAELLGRYFGLDLEVRAEGVAAIDPHDALTDRDFPDAGTLNQAALLVIDDLVALVEPEEVPNPRERIIVGAAIPDGLVRDVLDGLVAKHGKHWRKDYVANVDQLEADVVALLADMGLLAYRREDLTATRPGEGSLVLLAAAARYAAYAVAPKGPTAEDEAA